LKVGAELSDEFEDRLDELMERCACRGELIYRHYWYNSCYLYYECARCWETVEGIIPLRTTILDTGPVAEIEGRGRVWDKKWQPGGYICDSVLGGAWVDVSVEGEIRSEDEIPGQAVAIDLRVTETFVDWRGIGPYSYSRFITFPQEVWEVEHDYMDYIAQPLVFGTANCYDRCPDEPGFKEQRILFELKFPNLGGCRRIVSD
jgi:hypothetical protein